jgi:uncharacterized protein YgbK (DUF1537 family)
VNLANIFQATQRIEAALAAKTKAEADLATAQARIAELEGSAPTHTAEQIAEFEKRPTQEAFDAEKQRADKAEAALAAEQSAHQTYKDGETERCNAAIAAHLAGDHRPPVVNGKKTDTAKTCTREQFNAMSQAERSAFFKSGGKISQ